MIHGDEVLEILASKYERRPVLAFADCSNTADGDILFVTGNGINGQAEILRVLEHAWARPHGARSATTRAGMLCVSGIAPRQCSACKSECIHPTIIKEGSALLTEVIE